MQTDTSVKLAVRPFTADDYADITRLHNANFPEFKMAAGEFQFNITIDPDFYNRGIGRRLYDLVLREVQQFDPIAVDEWTRADMAWRIAFLERRGFVEDMRMWISALDLTEFDPSQYAAEVAAVEAQGFQLRSWEELGFDDPSVRQ